MPEFSIQQGTTIAIREAVVVTERRVRISVVMEMVARKPTIGKVGVGPPKAEPGKIAAEAAPWECAAAHVAFDTANYGDAVAVSHRAIHAATTGSVALPSTIAVAAANIRLRSLNMRSIGCSFSLARLHRRIALRLLACAEHDLLVRAAL